MHRVQHKWTQEEEDYLRQYYMTKPIEEILAFFPKRTKTSIIRKASSMGIANKDRCPNGRKWSSKEIAYLKKWYNVKPNSEIAKHLRRTSRSVGNKASELELVFHKKTQDKPWTEKEVAYLEKMYYKHGTDYIAKKLHRTITSVRKKAANLGYNAYVNDMLYISTIAKCFSCDVSVIHKWIDKHGLPSKNIQRGEITCRLVKVEDFWIWAKTHQDLVPWFKYEPQSLLPEPSWINDVVKEDYKKRNKHRKRISVNEVNMIASLRKQGYTYKQIASQMGRTKESIRHICKSKIKEG